VTVAARLAGVVRDGELLARVGGEEFAWILPDADADGVFAAAERARQAIRDRPLPGAGRVTISIGVAARGRGREAPALYEQADEALYLAKRHGRDRTIIWDSANATVVRSQSADG
jgi:diguanylate cyclase (GGDEF)-like protein